MHNSSSVWPLTWAAVQTRHLLLAHLQANATTNEADTVRVPLHQPLALHTASREHSEAALITMTTQRAWL